MKKILKTIVATILLVLFIIMIGAIFLPSASYDLYFKFLNLSDENREIYVNEKKVDNAYEIFNGLQQLTDPSMRPGRVSRGGCVNIKILSKEGGMSLCISDSNYNYFYVLIQRFYLKDSGWQPLYHTPGVLIKKHLGPYIKEALLQSKTDYTYNDSDGDATDAEILLKRNRCKQKKENGWKLDENDSNTTKEVCEIILSYFR